MHDIFPRELQSDWQRKDKAIRRGNARARWFFFILGLCLIGYMIWYGHHTDTMINQLHAVDMRGSYTDDVSGEPYANPI